MPRPVAPAEPRRELDRADHAVRNDGQDVQDHRDGLREEARVRRRHFSIAGQLREP
jgi:hypothetical protein